MPYLGYEPSKVAVTVGQGVIDASHIQDASITTADLGNDAVTPIKIDDDGTGFQMGSLGLGTAVSGSEKLTVGGTASFSGNITGTLATAAQTNITSVGTLTGLTTGAITQNAGTLTIKNASSDSNGLKILQDSSDASKIYNHYNGTLELGVSSTTTLAIKSSAVGIGTTSPATATNVLLTVGDTSLGYAGMEIRGGTNAESWRLYSSFDGSNDAIFGLFRVADSSYKLEVHENGNLTVGASNGSAEVRTNRARMRHIDGLADASDYSHGDLFINHISSGNIICSSNVGVGHTTPQFGLTLLEGDLDANSIGWESSGNTKRGSIRMNPADYMKFNIGGGDRLWIGNATNNWAMNLTGNSPYGMQIITTSDGSSSHDAFVIKRASNAKVFEIFNDGRVHCMKQLHIDTESASVYPSIVGETSNYELFRLEQWHGNEGSLVIKRDGSNKIRFTGGVSGVTSFINNGASFCIGRESALSPVARLVVASALDGGTTPAASFQANTNTGSGAVIVFHAGDGTEEGNVFMSNLNAGTGVSYNSSSDYRLKEKVKTLPNALDRVNQMKPVEFVWKKAKIKSEGFLAHELQEICDYAVSGEKDGDKMQQADYAKLTPILVKAIQELSAKVAELEKN
tara:strand:+ start:2864 stop:4744 length:1881 start_codon:yes stop_codon:yes gene_type:complete